MPLVVAQPLTSFQLNLNLSQEMQSQCVGTVHRLPGLRLVYLPCIRVTCLELNDEIVTVSRVTRLLSATLSDGLIAFWPLSEQGGIRKNIYDRYDMSAFSEANPVGFIAGAALFTGAEALRTPI